jgi:AGZA family xanthine/uracil permease-like MFS transporter
VVAALIPNIASWATGQMDNVLSAAGTTAADVGIGTLAGAGVVYDGLKTLGSGAILAGLILGAIVAFIIDKRFWNAAIFSGAGAVLTFVGLIHAEKVQWNADGQVSLGYLFLTVICVLFALTKPAPRVPDADELELERLHGGAPILEGNEFTEAPEGGVPEPEKAATAVS